MILSNFEDEVFLRFQMILKRAIYQSQTNVTYCRYAENETVENDSLIFYYKKALEEFVLIKDKKERNSHLDL